MTFRYRELVIPPGARNGLGRCGFTLIELLVVVAIVGILAGLLLPALSKAKSKAQGAYCLNNHRQLTLALQLYTDEQDDRLPYNLGADGTRATIAAQTYLNWVNNVMSWELDPENTNTFLAAAGGLGPYSGGVSAIFKCPSDRTLSGIQKRAGWTGRMRSVSLNAMLGNAGSFISGSVNTNNPTYHQYFKMPELRTPAKIFSFIDEHPDSINDGYFLNRLTALEWVDLPASYHNAAATLSFADGHVELHRWLYSSTRPPPRPDAALLPMSVPEDERADFDWLTLHTSKSYRYGPPKD